MNEEKNVRNRHRYRKKRLQKAAAVSKERNMCIDTDVKKKGRDCEQSKIHIKSFSGFGAHRHFLYAGKAAAVL